jgi:hypothetical protein
LLDAIVEPTNKRWEIGDRRAYILAVAAVVVATDLLFCRHEGWLRRIGISSYSCHHI